jgi:hypothetical protein
MRDRQAQVGDAGPEVVVKTGGSLDIHLQFIMRSAD